MQRIVHCLQVLVDRHTTKEQAIIPLADSHAYPVKHWVAHAYELPSTYKHTAHMHVHTLTLSTCM